MADPGRYASNGDAEMHLGATEWYPLVYPCILWLCYRDIDRWIPYENGPLVFQSRYQILHAELLGGFDGWMAPVA